MAPLACCRPRSGRLARAAFEYAPAHFLCDQCNRCSSLSCSASAAAACLLLVVVLVIVKVLQFTTELVGVKGISHQ
jgi:hypothetical protein